MRGTIKSSREIDRAFRSGRRVSTYLFSTRICRSSTCEGNGRMAFIAGKRVGNAVARNRAKRMMREAARHQGAPWKGYDIIFLANERTGSADIHELDKACEKVIRSLVSIDER